MFGKDEMQRTNICKSEYQKQSFINKINLKKTAYTINNDKIEMEENDTSEIYNERPARLRDQILKLKTGQVYEVLCSDQHARYDSRNSEKDEEKYLVHII